jgi:hypothetical protein
MKAVICPYCGSHAVLKDAFVIYRRTGFGQVYQCANAPACDAYVGVHDNTTKPKGSLANLNLRELRKKVHAVFDPLWRGNRTVERSEVYAAAAQALGLKGFHIGDMRDEQAQAFLDHSEELIENIRLAIQRNRLMQLAPKSSDNLLNVLRYLYVGSQRYTAHVLPHNAYRGHVCSFKAAMEAGLVRRIKKQETGKAYYALTPAGCSAIGIASN